MDYATGLQRALEYIEQHLQDETDISQIAKQAACSPFYFQRIFGLLCGMTLGEYIRNRRLAIAGSELQNKDQKVIDIAFKYGYDSPESFTRAFTKFHGVTPSQVKKGNCKLRSFSPLSVNLILKGGFIMNYKIVKKEAFCVLEKVSRHSVSDEKNKTSIPSFWSACHEDGTVRSLLQYTSDKTFVFGICYGQKGDQGTFEYSVAALCDVNIPAPAGFRKNLIPARTWAVFDCVGAMPNAIQELWHAIVSEFFPTAGYRPTFELDIEAYPSGDMNTADYHSEIWVPIEKN